MPPRRDQSLRVLGAVLLPLAAMLSVAASQIVLGFLLVILFWRWRHGAPPPRTGLEWPVLALVLWALVMIACSPDRGQSLLYARRWYLFAPIWVAAGLGAAPGVRLAALGSLATGAVLSAGHGLLRYLHLGGARYEAGGQWAGRAAPLAGDRPGGGLHRLAGLVLGAALLTAGRRRRRRRRRAWLAAALAVVLGCLSLTLTRSAWLGFAAGAIIMVALVRRRWLPAAGLALLAAALVLPDTMRTRLLSAFDPADAGNAQRVLMWRTGWQWVQEKPLCGRGDRDLKNEYRAYHAERPQVEIQGHLHSNVLMAAVIWGVPGLLLVLLVLGLVWRQLWLQWRALGGAGQRSPPPAGDDLVLARAWCLGAMGAWTGFNVAGLFEWNFGDAEVALLLWLIVGLGLAPLAAPGKRKIL